jgi:hypothetical protein
VSIGLLVAIGFGGYFATGSLSATAGKHGVKAAVFETTVSRVVTVREQGRLVRKLVPVVHRVTVAQVRTVTAAGATHVVTTEVLRRIVANGKPTTVVVTRVGPTRQLPGRTVHLTAQRTVTAQHTVTAQRTVTARRVLTSQRTVTSIDTQTETQTQTQTQTQVRTTTRVVATTVPVTVVRTETETETRTETLPAETVTTVLTVTVKGH